MVCYGWSCFRWYMYFKICENKESSYLNYYNFMAIMKYFDSNMVNFAEINNIRVNITYVWTTSFSAILWCFRAQTILWRSLFQRKIYWLSLRSHVFIRICTPLVVTVHCFCHGCLRIRICFLQHPILELVINVYNKLSIYMLLIHKKHIYITQKSSLTFL